MNKLNPHSALPSFYRYFYLTGYIPNNLCNYFWGLLIAFVCLPFVWPAVLINRLQNKIFFDDSTSDNWGYDGVGKFKIIKTTPRNLYVVKRYKMATVLGFFISILILVAGAIAGVIIHRLTHYNIVGKDASAISVIFNLYITGILAIVTCILLFYLVMAIVRKISQMEKEPTEEEIEAKAIKDAERYERRTQRSFDRAKRIQSNPGFFRLTWRWLKAFKEKNCPIIDWDYEKKPNSK